jgi:hypothetical protein
MTAAQFNTELTDLVSRAVKDSFKPKQMPMQQIASTLNIHSNRLNASIQLVLAKQLSKSISKEILIAKN